MSDADARKAEGREGLNRPVEAAAESREGLDRPSDAAAEARGAAGREGLNRPVEATAAETRGGAERPAGPTGAESRGAGPSGGASVTRLIEERDGAVLILTIDQPARRNALAMPIRAAMISALEHAQTDSAIRAVVVTGSGGHFCSGGDIAGMEVNSAMAGRERMRLSHQLIRLMVLGSLPVVAAVEGYCVGAGLSLACASDTVVAAEDARFGAGFGKIGLMADLGLPHTLPLRVGQGRARQILLYHGQMTAPEAERIGLVDHVVPKGHALQAALEKARFLAEQAPAPMALTKQMLGEGLDRALEQERHFQATLFLTEDFAEGRAAFLAKRTPIFKGA